eukprot:scaffold7234_cov181-Amphora_coffeaeformis.AAC.5
MVGRGKSGWPKKRDVMTGGEVRRYADPLSNSSTGMYNSSRKKRVKNISLVSPMRTRRKSFSLSHSHSALPYIQQVDTRFISPLSLEGAGCLVVKIDCPHHDEIDPSSCIPFVFVLGHGFLLGSVKIFVDSSDAAMQGNWPTT